MFICDSVAIIKCDKEGFHWIFQHTNIYETMDSLKCIMSLLHFK